MLTTVQVNLWPQQEPNSPRLIQAQALAQKLNLALVSQDPKFSPETDLFLLLNDAGLSLQQGGRKAPGASQVDFSQPALLSRLKSGDKMLSKALGCKRGKPYRILDATAGFGVDAALMASMGFDITLLERNPVVAQLLGDGIRRAQSHSDNVLQHVSQRLHLAEQDSLALLAGEQRFDVIYLDPMFPERKKSALVKKGMQYFHQIVGSDEDADALLPLALERANYRVVVKRPRVAPFLADTSPSFQLSGKAHRYDVYALKAFS